MIDEFSMIFPCEENRLPLFLKTLSKYSEHGLPENYEIIVVSRTIKKFFIQGMNIKLVNYEYEGEHFNPAMALNIGVRNATYKNIIISCPEVMPISNVLQQLSNQVRGNYVCQVFDLNQDGTRRASLVNSSYRQMIGMYFLACMRKEDIEKINGWDEDFMGGYCFEDNDFDSRWKRANIPFSIKDGIIGEHQFHPRFGESPGWSRNKLLFEENNRKGIIRPKNGLVKE